MPVVITQSVRAQGKNRNVIEYVTFRESARKKHLGLTNKFDIFATHLPCASPCVGTKGNCSIKSTINEMPSVLSAGCNM